MVHVAFPSPDLKLIIVSFGKLKLPGARAWADHYISKLDKRRDFTFEEVELPESSPKPAWECFEDWTKAHAPKSRSVFLLDEEGKNWSSMEWTQNLERSRDQGKSWILAIGPADGWKIKDASVKKISLGAQTLAHDLAKIVLLEQIYRACAIQDGHPYHRV